MSKIVSSVIGAGLREQAARAVGALEQDVVAAADQDHDAGDLAAGDGFVGGVVDSGKVERSGNCGRRGEGGRGKREQSEQSHDGDAHLRILAL